MFADIGIGIILSVVWSKVFGIEPTNFIISLGIIFALFPDFDFILASVAKLFGLIKFKSINKHREISHFPILYILLFFVIFLIWGKFIGLLFLSNIVWHFFHDSFGIGWGIKWLWPVSNNSYKLFSDQKGKTAWQIAIWNRQEETAVEENYGNPHWVKDIYFQPTFISVSEFVIFILGCMVWIFS